MAISRRLYLMNPVPECAKGIECKHHPDSQVYRFRLAQTGSKQVFLTLASTQALHRKELFPRRPTDYESVALTHLLLDHIVLFHKDFSYFIAIQIYFRLHYFPPCSSFCSFSVPAVWLEGGMPFINGWALFESFDIAQDRLRELVCSPWTSDRLQILGRFKKVRPSRPQLF